MYLENMRTGETATCEVNPSNSSVTHKPYHHEQPHPVVRATLQKAERVRAAASSL